LTILGGFWEVLLVFGIYQPMNDDSDNSIFWFKIVAALIANAVVTFLRVGDFSIWFGFFVFIPILVFLLFHPIIEAIDGQKTLRPKVITLVSILAAAELVFLLIPKADLKEHGTGMVSVTRFPGESRTAAASAYNSGGRSGTPVREGGRDAVILLFLNTIQMGTLWLLFSAWSDHRKAMKGRF
jgi:hypothetical protein